MEDIDKLVSSLKDGKEINEKVSIGKERLYKQLVTYIVDKIETFMDKDVLEEVKPINDRLKEIELMLRNKADAVLLNPSAAENIEQRVKELNEEKANLIKEKNSLLSNNASLYAQIQTLLVAYNQALEHLPSQKKYTSEEILDVIRHLYVEDGKIVSFELECFAKVRDAFNIKYYDENNKAVYYNYTDDVLDGTSLDYEEDLYNINDSKAFEKTEKEFKRLLPLLESVVETDKMIN